MEQHIWYQRLEGVSVFVVALYFYFSLHFPLLWFVIFLLAIDLSMAGYGINRVFGAHVYNLAHIALVPAALLVSGFALHHLVLVAAACVWLAHIGIDRAFGFGLKCCSGFHETHLGRIGRV